ncbi:MAG: sigma-54-dependent Fis family transcriptional regulator, partial [Bacteroidales bacterium]|nr:sigma-54-dependent Fis family transcriptional regulator [Bacteroidales bacterium]
NLKYWKGKKPNLATKKGIIDKPVVFDAIAKGEEACGIIKTVKGKEVIVRCKPVYNSTGKIKFLVSTSTTLNELNNLWVQLVKERKKGQENRREIHKLRDVLMIGENFIFESPGMRETLNKIKKIAPVDCNLLITGESGVGKDSIAKTIHKNSPRAQEPFIPVNISALPENLIEAEIFGYEGGAFTGASNVGKNGLFELAHGGTLFLDEVGDIPHNTQVKILRAIEEGEIRRLGSNRRIKLDIRIIAATNKDLMEMIKKRYFRDDLFYRLSVIQLHIKPLRERIEDINPLCRSFINNFNYKYNMSKRFSDSAFYLLEQFSWLGNVRELKNFVEKCAILSEKDIITAEDIRSNSENITNFTTSQQFSTKPDVIKDYEINEKNRILEALEYCKGNKSKAATHLGISRSTLYRKIKEL